MNKKNTLEALDRILQVAKAQEAANNNPQPEAASAITIPQPHTFTFGDMQVRMIEDVQTGEPLFCLADICKGCGLSTPAKMAKQVKEEFGLGELNSPNVSGLGELKTAPLLDAVGRIRTTTVVTEPQMYFVMMRGRSEAAKQFRQWICNEVLPSIRRTGSYVHTKIQIPQIGANGHYDVSYLNVAAQFQNELRLDEKAGELFQWIMDRAKAQGMAIAFRKVEERGGDANAAELEFLRAEVTRLSKEVDLCQLLDGLKRGALATLLKYPDDPAVRNLAQQVLGVQYTS